MDVNIERKQRAVDNVCFEVDKVRLPEGGYGIVDRQYGNVISRVSERYTLVKNSDIFLPFVEKFGIEKLSHLSGYGNRKFYIAKFFTGREFDFGTPEQKDIVKEQIVIQNSYNKTKSFSFMFGAFRLVCTNGLYTGEAVINYKKIHVGEIPVRELVSEVFNNFEKNHFESWTKLRKIPLTLESQIKLLENYNAFEPNESEQYSRGNILNRDIRYTAKYYLEKEENIDNQRNGWGLLNQVNRSINANLRGKSQVGQVINANKRLESYLVSTLLN